MVTNRSVPTDSILPHVVYQDVGKASVWLSRAFGFVEHYRYGDPADPSGAQVSYGQAFLMLEKARPGRKTPSEIGVWTQMLTVFVEDIDAHYTQAVVSGATVVEKVNETIYGERQYCVLDLDGHPWLFSQHIRDADPAEWGAVVPNAS